MSLQRIRMDIQQATEHFPYVETHTTPHGDLYVKAALQTSIGQMYVLSVTFAGYPSEMPKVTVITPAVAHGMHMYNTGNICYMHPSVWNPAKHDLKYVLAQAAVWLNKHEVYKATQKWPGPGLPHPL